MQITQYLNQTVTLEKYTGDSQWGDPMYTAPQTVAARKTTKHKMMKRRNEVYYVPVTEILTEVEVLLRDKIDGEEILALEHFVDFDGTIIGYKCFPRPPIGFTP